MYTKSASQVVLAVALAVSVRARSFCGEEVSEQAPDSSQQLGRRVMWIAQHHLERLLWQGRAE